MTLFTAVIAVAAVTVLSGHVAPSVDDNNRYLKITPLRAGFRLAYTVFFGEIPGASERRQLDTNRDGRIDASEAKRYGDRLAAQVADALYVETSGTPQRVQWTTVDVGLGGRDAVVGGAFSIDMIGYLCVPGSSKTHRVRLRDAFRIPRPGETEVKVEDSPGVTVRRARVGTADDPTHDYRFVGPGGPLSDPGLDVEWVTTTDAPLVPGGKCVANDHNPKPPWWIGPLVLGGLVVVAGLVVLVRRRWRSR